MTPQVTPQVKSSKGAECFQFRLYVAGDTPNSERARVNLGALCRKYLGGRYKIQIIDVFKDPNRAMIDGVLLTPTLIKLVPSPVRMIVGTLSPSASLMDALGLTQEIAWQLPGSA